VTFTCNYLFMCSGYYSYKGGHTPEFAGIDSSPARSCTRRQWPEDLDYAGKRVVVIGSGATAMTLVPAMADRRPRHDAAALAHLRGAGPTRTSIANVLRKVLPDKARTRSPARRTSPCSSSSTASRARSPRR
jgi:monooxygenase